MFGAMSTYSKLLSDLCERNLKLAVDADKTLKMVKPTHAIILYYQALATAPAKGYISWHQDNGENDGKEDYPIVSFSLGNSCDFLVAHSKPKTSPTHPAANPQNLAHRILYESGDVLVNGGPCRLMWHSIFKMHPNTAPGFLPLNNARLNVTLRYTPDIVGDEARFATPQDSSKLPRDNQFYKVSKMK